MNAINFKEPCDKPMDYSFVNEMLDSFLKNFESDNNLKNVIGNH